MIIVVIRITIIMKSYSNLSRILPSDTLEVLTVRSNV